MVWQLISPEVSVECCMKCFIVSAMDETDMLCSGDVRSVREMRPIVKYFFLSKYFIFFLGGGGI
jgi:hypothetical protein